MAMEIERKFLVRDESWRAAVAQVHHIRQGYLQRREALSVRVRIVDNKAATLTIKSGDSGPGRHEFEYPIPVGDAEQLLSLCSGALIVKTRHDVPFDGLTWEIDVFEAENAGLVVAEIELESESQSIRLPSWLGNEITGEPRYYNACLTEHPFRSWMEQAQSPHQN